MTALRGGDGPLTEADLADDQLKTSVTKLLSGVDRSSGSSDWLKDMVVANPDRFDAMVNYESLVIQADKALDKDGHDPLLTVYPSDGIAVSDSPFGYVDRGQKLKSAFASFSKALGSKDAKLEFERAGRRTGLGGTLAYATDSQVKQSFRAEWGVNTDASALKTIPLPAATVIDSALNVYQTALDELPSESEASQYTTAIVLMTDGRSNSDHQDEFESAYKSRGRDLPIFSIMFGDADPSQLKSLATLSNAKVFDGRSGDLAAVFRQVKGFN